MSIFRYIKKNGIKHFFEVLYKYKIDVGLIKFIAFFTGKMKLLNIIIIESHNDFDCNGGALYNYLITNKYNKKYRIILLLHNELTRKLPTNVIGYRLRIPNIKKDYYITRAKFFFADQSSTPKVRDDQVSVYLTHGAVPIKNTNKLICLPYNTDYCLSPSTYFDKFQRKAFTIENINTKMLHLGFPCLDDLFNETESDLDKITDDKYNKKVIWMPTLHKGGGKRNDFDYDLPLGIPLIKTLEQFNCLNAYLKTIDMLLIIKIHPKQELSNLLISNTSNVIVLTGKDMKDNDLSNYRLYKDMDALISDYSSAAFDYLNLNRPIGFDFSDFSHYKVGLLMDDPEKFLPGRKIYDYNDFVNFLADISNERDLYKKQREELINCLFEQHDGDSCKRIVEFLQL